MKHKLLQEKRSSRKYIPLTTLICWVHKMFYHLTFSFLSRDLSLMHAIPDFLSPVIRGYFLLSVEPLILFLEANRFLGCAWSLDWRILVETPLSSWLSLVWNLALNQVSFSRIFWQKLAVWSGVLAVLLALWHDSGKRIFNEAVRLRNEWVL